MPCCVMISFKNVKQEEIWNGGECFHFVIRMCYMGQPHVEGYQSLHVCVMVFPTSITNGEENGGWKFGLFNKLWVQLTWESCMSTIGMLACW